MRLVSAEAQEAGRLLPAGYPPATDCPFSILVGQEVWEMGSG